MAQGSPALEPSVRLGGQVSHLHVSDAGVVFSQGRRLSGFDPQAESVQWTFELEAAPTILEGAGSLLAAVGPVSTQFYALQGNQPARPRGRVDVSGAIAMTPEAAFILQGSAIAIFDLSDPDAPQILADDLLADVRPGIDAEARSVTAAGERLLVGVELAGTNPPGFERWLLDVEDPARPAFGSVLPALPEATGRSFVAAGSTDREDRFFWLLGQSDGHRLFGLDGRDAAAPTVIADAQVTLDRGRDMRLTGMAVGSQGRPVLATGEWHSGFTDQGAILTLGLDGTIEGYVQPPTPVSGPIDGNGRWAFTASNQGIWDAGAWRVVPVLQQAISVAANGDLGRGLLVSVGQSGPLVGYQGTGPNRHDQVGALGWGRYRGCLEMDLPWVAACNLGVLDLPSYSIDTLDLSGWMEQPAAGEVISGGTTAHGTDRAIANDVLWVANRNQLVRHAVASGQETGSVDVGPVKHVAANEDWAVTVVTVPEAGDVTTLSVLRAAEPITITDSIELPARASPGLPWVGLIDHRVFVWSAGPTSGPTSSLWELAIDGGGHVRLESELAFDSVPLEVQLADGLILARLPSRVLVVNARGDTPWLAGEGDAPTTTGQTSDGGPDTMTALDGWLYVAHGSVRGYELPATWLGDDGPVPSETPAPGVTRSATPGTSTPTATPSPSATPSAIGSSPTVSPSPSASATQRPDWPIFLPTVMAR